MEMVGVVYVVLLCCIVKENRKILLYWPVGAVRLVYVAAVWCFSFVFLVWCRLCGDVVETKGCGVGDFLIA